ncbi:MAG: hypothetical protein HC908_07575 [Calothrix sp. SM1_7_51]|nr:hypothetical protein [Calothrix sp. SM1_7_51]
MASKRLAKRKNTTTGVACYAGSTVIGVTVHVRVACPVRDIVKRSAYPLSKQESPSAMRGEVQNMLLSKNA